MIKLVIKNQPLYASFFYVTICVYAVDLVACGHGLALERARQREILKCFETIVTPRVRIMHETALLGEENLCLSATHIMHMPSRRRCILYARLFMYQFCSNRTRGRGKYASESCDVDATRRTINGAYFERVFYGAKIRSVYPLGRCWRPGI